MKHYSYLFLIFICLYCKKEQKLSAPGPFRGTGSAVVNGQNWKAHRVECRIDVPCYPGRLSIAFHTFSSEGFLRETMVIYKMPIIVKESRIDTVNYATLCSDTSVGANYGTIAGHGDISKDYYTVLESESNKINITYYNPETKIVIGTFDVSFIIKSRQDPLAPDTIRFMNGRFLTKILR